VSYQPFGRDLISEKIAQKERAEVDERKPLGGSELGQIYKQ